MRETTCPVTLLDSVANRLNLRAAVAAVLLAGSALYAQQDNPVYVDDSPQAWELYRQADDQSRHNVGEAVRLYQEMLDEFALKLIPVSEAASDHFTSVRRRVHSALRSDPSLLARYRTIQTPEAQRMLEAGQLQRVARTRLLTQPGLDALLQLAQHDLETGRFHSALNRLEEASDHPDLGGRSAAHAWFMRALALHDLGQVAAAAGAREALLALGPEAAPFAAQLDEIMHSKAPSHTQALTILERAPATELSDLVPQAIWTAPFESRDAAARPSALNESTINVQLRPDGRAVAAERAVAAPTVAGNAVYVNHGHAVMALNRLTGRRLWSYTEISRFGLLDRENAEPLDLNVVAVGDGSVVTLTGHAQAGTRTDGGKVLCLDAASGVFRWAGTLSGLVESSAGEELFPHGAPVIADSTVFIMARKVSQQLLTSAYVIAVDLRDGTVRWIQYLTSSGGLRGIRPFCSLRYDDGSLYIASAVGAAARLDPATGEIRWLQRFGVPISPMLMDQTRKPWEVTAPVITSRGMVAVQSDQRRVALLDLETGDILESHSASSSADWSMPRYLLADDEHVYAVGSDIRAFAIEDLERPLWRLPPLPTTSLEPDLAQSAPAPSSLELRGRVQLLEGALIVPATQGILVVDSATGRVAQTLAVAPGNPLAADSQLLLAGTDRLEAFMSFDRAERMLRERIASNANDPEPALSLLRLGIRVRNMPLCLEAAELATNAVNRMLARDIGDRGAAAARNELFALLVDLAGSGVASSVDEGEALFAALDAVAIEREQRVDYLLAYGDWLSSHALNRAVENYQKILDPNEGLAHAWRDADGIARPAQAWAAARLARLIEQRGRSVYGPQSDYAAMRLRALVQKAGPGRDPDPQGLAELAQESPFAGAAHDAAVLAADIYARRQDYRSALRVLLGLYDLGPSAQSASCLLGRAVAICEQEQPGWTDQARTTLEHVARNHGDLPMAAPAGERRALAWLDALNAATLGTAARRARLGQTVEGLAEHIPNTTLIPAAGSIPLPADRALLRSEGTTQMRGADLSSIWSEPLSAESLQVLRWGEQSILLAANLESLDPRAIRVNSRTGKVISESPPLQQIIGGGPEPGRNANRRGTGLPGLREAISDQQFLDGLPVAALAHPSHEAIVMLRGDGSGAAIDLRTSRPTVLWTRPASAEREQVYAADLHDAALVLATVRRDAANRLVGTSLVHLNPWDGEPFDSPVHVEARPVLGRNGIRWMVRGPLGVLVVGSIDGIEAVDLFSGERRWTQTSYDALDSQRAWIVDDRVIFEDQRARLRSLDIATGALSDSFENPARGEWETMELLQVIPYHGQALAHYRQRLALFDPTTGAIVGADAIGQNRDFRWIVPLDSHLLVVDLTSDQVAMGERGARQTRYQYQIHVLSQNGLALRDPFALEPLHDRLQQLHAVDGWLLGSTSAGTLAIRIPAQ